MIKHPAFRVRSSADIYKPVHDEFAADCWKYISLTPYADLVTDICEVGSYPCERAELHSDMDINQCFKSQADMLLAGERIKENTDQFLQALAWRNQIMKKWGLRIDFVRFDYDLSLTPKTYFSLKEMKLHAGDKRRIDKIDGVYVERVIHRVRTPRLGIVVPDEEVDVGFRPFRPGDTHDMYDPWFSELPEWEKKLKGKLLKYGETEETNWMKHVPA